MLRSPRNSRTGLHPHTGPQITTTPRPRTASPSSPLNRPSLQTLAVARPRPNPHSKRAGTAQYVPFLAVSSLGGFQTPAAVRAGMFVTAGVWKPSHNRTSGHGLDLAFASLANDGRGRYCPLALWSNALSAASVIAVTPVWMVGLGPGANSGEWLPGSGVPLLLAAAHFSSSYTPILNIIDGT